MNTSEIYQSQLNQSQNSLRCCISILKHVILTDLYGQKEIALQELERAIEKYSKMTDISDSYIMYEEDQPKITSICEIIALNLMTDSTHPNHIYGLDLVAEIEKIRNSNF